MTAPTAAGLDFFGRQERVRRLSIRLVLLFLVAVLGIVLTVDLVVVVAIGAQEQPIDQLVPLVALVSIATLTAIALAALTRTAQLRGGGGVVARGLGGVLVPPDTTDPQLRRLRNVVEEMAIASGVSVPAVYVLPHEPGINAFAAGWSTGDAAIAVTRGALERLNRDELQGVIAHEFSHVVNGDMRLNIRLMGLLFGILFLTVIGRILLRSGAFGGRRGRDGGRNPLPFIGLGLLVVGFVGVLAGRLIQAAVSRQREYLADVSAVQFTRQTAGLVGALKKIGGVAEGSTMRTPRSDEVGHMLFGAGKRLHGLFATHPPLAKRIKVLDPSFDPAQLAELHRRWTARPPSGLAEDAARGLREPGVVEAVVPAGQIVAQIGAQSPDSYHRAQAILARIPEPLRERAHHPDTALPLVLGLLMSGDPEVRAAQHTAVAQRYGQAVADAALREAEALVGLDPLVRLPLAELAFPALRQRPPADREIVLDAVDALVRADERVSVFEYCLSRLLRRELYESVHPPSGWRVTGRGDTLAANADAVLTLLAVLAQAGHESADRAERAFQAGLRRALPDRVVGFHPAERGVTALEDVWVPLDGLAPAEKERLVQAAVDVISADRELTVTELELLRTICALLHCPLPPLAVPA
jgi:Zn-dependent protease with chaperone function